MKQYKSLDLAKFICAILIIVLHTAPFSSYSKLLTFGFRNIITIIAVPFFFLTSGFLAFKKLDSLEGERKGAYIVQYLKRLFVMYLIWSAVYFVFVVISWSREGFSMGAVLEYVKNFFFEGSYSTIWFLPALFAATLLVYWLHKRWSYRMIFAIACAIYLFTLGASSYYGLAEQVSALKAVYELYYSVFDTVKNGVCFGLIFVSMGAMISECEEKITQATTALRAFVPVVGFAVLLSMEAVLVAYFNWNLRGVDTLLMLAPFTYFLVRFLLVWDIKLGERACAAMRKYSILMFLTQRIPMSILALWLSDTVLVQNSMVYFVTVFGATLLISFGILQASKKVTWLKFAY